MAEEVKSETAAAAPAAPPAPEGAAAAAPDASPKAPVTEAKEDDTSAKPLEAIEKDTPQAEAAAEVPTAAEPAASDEKDEGAKEPAGDAAEGAKAAADADEAANAATNGTADASKKDKKRRSSAGIPEHKSKKLNKRKSMPQLQLDVEPGQFWFARMRGHPPWPSVICDEQMLPVSLISKRPVSAKRVDGTWRADFEIGGKNTRERRYPVMFLATNEFAWQPNTDLLPLNMDEVKDKVENGTQGKMPAKLWEAYKIAAGEHDLDYFKSVLMEHEKAIVKEQEAREEEEERLKQEAEAAEQAAAEAAEKKREKAEQQKNKKKAKADGDVEMTDADKAAKSKKRKKGEAADGDAEDGAKPPKTPKLKLTNKGSDNPTAESETKAKKAKPAKKAAAKDAAATEEKKQETEAEKLEKRQKLVLFLRHRLQKGFLDKNTPPKDEDMPDMSVRLADLEKHENLEVSIIKGTKINKVLKQLLRIEYIPRDEEFNFRQRATNLLAIYNKSMELETPTPAPSAPGGADATEAKTNGVKQDEPTKEGAPHEEQKDEKMVEAEESKKKAPEVADEQGDVSMTDVKPEEPATEGAAETPADAPVASTEEPAVAA